MDWLIDAARAAVSIAHKPAQPLQSDADVWTSLPVCSVKKYPAEKKRLLICLFLLQTLLSDGQMLAFSVAQWHSGWSIGRARAVAELRGWHI